MVNQIKTIILLSSLSVLCISVGNLVGGTSGMFIALLCALVMNGCTYFFSDRLVLRMYQAQPLNKKEYASVYTITRDLARTMNIPMPSLWLITTPMANAFATGRSPEHASIAVTTGIIGLLNENELTGVLAHELAHIKNRDILISTIAATCAAALSYLAHMAYYIPLHRSSDNNSKRSTMNPLVYFLIIFITPLAATVLQLALSRTREFEADRVGACSCHDPRALAHALEKIHLNVAQQAMSPKSADPLYASTASLFIINPLKTREWITTLFSTHPPLNERVARLYAMIKENQN